MSPSAAPSPLVVGLDIGTTKTCAIVAGEDENGALSILGIGVRPSSGVRRGVVVDVPDTVATIKDALARAAHMAGVEIEGVVAGVTGDHILSQNRWGSVTVASPGGEIGSFDVGRALAATLLEIGRDVEVIHCSPRSFSLDGQTGLRKPVGLVGSRLEVEAHVVTGQSSLLRNTFSCLSGAGVRADALVLEPLATAEAVTTRSEREMGVLVLDIGGGTSDLAAFVDDSAIYSAALPVGGNHVTRDISIGLSTPFEFAETLKVGSGAATRDMIPHGEALEVLTAGGASRLRIPRALLGEIIEARMRELFELSLAMAMESGLAGRVPGGLIMSGGGALLPGAIELAGKIFGLPVRLGVPEGVAGWSEQVAAPQFATAVGLCRFALAQQTPDARRGAMMLPHVRRVWSQLPPGVVLARSVVPVPAVTPVLERETPRTALPVPASEEFPAQMQFAPTRPQEPDAPQPNDTPFSPKPVAVAAVPTSLPFVPPATEPKAAPQEPKEPSSPAAGGADAAGGAETVPLLAVKDKDEAALSTSRPASASRQASPSLDTPLPNSVPALRPIESSSFRETGTNAHFSASARPAQPEPADADASGSVGLPSPPESPSGRFRLQDFLARAGDLFDSPSSPTASSPTASSPAASSPAASSPAASSPAASSPAASSPAASSPAASSPAASSLPAPVPDEAQSSAKPLGTRPSAGDSRALHWWLRFKTFIGFGEE